MTTNSLAEALEGVAAAFAFSRMTDEQKDRHLKDLEIRNIQDDVKWYNRSIAYSRKKIAELYEIASGVPTPSDVYWLKHSEQELAVKIANRTELKAKIKELRK
jgi:hypothetical protein